MQRPCDWVKGRSISVSYIYIYMMVQSYRGFCFGHVVEAMYTGLHSMVC